MSTPSSKDTVATKLHELRPGLPPSEGRVARTLLDGYPVAGIGTLAELAERARVSGPTVLRLVNRLGFTTFGDFQRALRDEVQERLCTAGRAIAAEPLPSDGHLVRTLLDEAARNIAADARSLEPAEMDAVVELLALRSRSVVCVGGWLTQSLALFCHTQLQLMRPRCRYIGPSNAFSAGELLDIGRRDTVVAFDARPYSSPTGPLCAWARGRGARVVLFTDAWLSPISRLASNVLVARTASSAPFDSYAPLLALLEAVLAAVAAELGGGVQRRISEGEAMLDAFTWQLGAQDET